MKLFFYSIVAIHKTTNELSHVIGTKHAENETDLITSLIDSLFEGKEDGKAWWTTPSILVEEVI